MKHTLKSEIIPLLLIIFSIALGIYFYSIFPDKVPMHWNIAGQVDRYGSKIEGVLIGPITLLFIYLLFLIIPIIDPNKNRYHEFTKAYYAIRMGIMLAIFAIFLIASLNGLGYDINIGIWVPIIIGVLFIVMGSFLNHIKPNWFMGIRTPWTLSSEEVWEKTHCFGGKMFMMLGLLFLLTPLWPASSLFWTLIAPAIIAGIAPIIYSYIIFKKLKK